MDGKKKRVVSLVLQLKPLDKYMNTVRKSDRKSR